MTRQTKEKSSFYNEYVQKMANLFIEKMKEGVMPWQMGWDTYGVSQLPQSAVSKKSYRGMNALSLYLMQTTNNYKDPRWITYKQATELGGHVKKGEHGTVCIYWKKYEYKAKTERDKEKQQLDQQKGKVESQKEGKDKESEEKKLQSSRLIPCPFVVFNVEQCEGLNLEAFEPKKHEWNPIEKAEKLVKATNAVIKHEKSENAYYSPKKDEIHLPLKEQFLSPEHYYDTLLHETSHWTGHPSRLNRPMSGFFGSEEYAREELRAEIASAMLSSTIGIPHNLGNHVSYVKSWINVLENDPKEIFRAAADADKIKDFIISKDKELMEELYGKPLETKSKQIEEKAAKNEELKKAICQPEFCPTARSKGNDFRLNDYAQTQSVFIALTQTENTFTKNQRL